MSKISWKKGLLSSVAALMLVAGSSTGLALASEADLAAGLNLASVRKPIVEWEKNYEGTVTSITSVIQNASGEFLFGGLGRAVYDSGGDAYLAVLARADQQGTLEWSREIEFKEKTYGHTVNVNYVKPTRDGGYIISGEAPSFHWRYSSGYIAKTDRNGELLWDKYIEGAGQVNIESLIESTDGGFIYSTNEFLNNAGVGGASVGKIDQDGQREWHFSLGHSRDDSKMAFISNAEESEDGGAIVAGYLGQVFKLWKISANGAVEWNKEYPGIRGQVKTVEQGYLIASQFAEDLSLLKTDLSGNEEWRKKVGSGSSNGIHVNPQGYLIAGTNGIYQTDSSGQLLWSKALEGVTVAESLKNREIIAVTDKTQLAKLSWTSPADPGNPSTDPNLPGDGLKFEDETYSISLGDTFDTVVKVDGPDGSPVTVTKFSTFTTDNPEVLTIDTEGNITGVKRGVAVISANYGGKTATATVNVY